jgi:SAM-dependent methyltransferase
VVVIDSPRSTFPVLTFASALLLPSNPMEKSGDGSNTGTQEKRPSKRHRRNSLEWRLYPSKRAFPKTGDAVFVKSKDTQIRYSRGKVSSNNSEHGIQVQPDDAKQAPLKLKDCKRLIPVFPDKATVVVTAETIHFRQLVHQIKSTDDILEIGCSTGETSRLLIPCANSWVGFDTSDEMIDQCRPHLEKNEKTHIVKVDALIDPAKALKEARTFGSPNVLFLDIGGNRESINVLRMVSWVLESFDPRLVVIKSRELVQSMQATATIDPTTGLIQNGDDWFQTHKTRRAIPKHPLRAPLVLSPKDGKTPICRYHNYHKQGCKKDECALDHDHCHACQQLGHIARECPSLTKE